jgi:hypothetical protein
MQTTEPNLYDVASGQATDAEEDPRVAAGLAEMAAAAARLRNLALDLEDEEPGMAFDPAWLGEDRL